ncbi:MAG TPA: hypothetical protein VHT70_02395 [Candidatus Saccharimonadales bacterium]|nr:hypothetical protein [Candidatus Saccharimonadales bacterium]
MDTERTTLAEAADDPQHPFHYTEVPAWHTLTTIGDTENPGLSLNVTGVNGVLGLWDALDDARRSRIRANNPAQNESHVYIIEPQLIDDETLRTLTHDTQQALRAHLEAAYPEQL